MQFDLGGGFDQLLFFTGDSISNRSIQVNLANVVRASSKILISPINNDHFSFSLGPIFDYINESPSYTSRGHSIGGEVSSYFFFKKSLGLQARYTVDKFDYSEPNIEDAWSLNVEHLELGVSFNFNF